MICRQRMFYFSTIFQHSLYFKIYKYATNYTKCRVLCRDQAGKALRLRLARAAFTQLPPELQQHAMKDDLAPLPADFPRPLPHPPLPGQDIYGEFQLPKHMKRKVQTGLDFDQARSARVIFVNIRKISNIQQIKVYS